MENSTGKDGPEINCLISGHLNCTQSRALRYPYGVVPSTVFPRVSLPLVIRIGRS